MPSKPAYQDVWLLHQRGKSVREIAFALDLSDRTVEDRLRAARRYYREREEHLSLVEGYPDEARRQWMEKRLERWLQR